MVSMGGTRSTQKKKTNLLLVFDSFNHVNHMEEVSLADEFELI